MALLTARLRPRTAAAWTPWLIALGIVGVGLPVVAAALSGDLTIPHNDGWSMSRIAETFAHTGQIHLLNWNDMNLIGQVVLLGPLGSSLVVQQVTAAALSAVCLFCVYRLLAVSLTTRDALLGTVLLGVWPGWASLSTSFETDVPAFAATFAALLLGRRALMRDSVGWLAATWLVSIWAVSIREQAIVAPATILVYGWITRRSRPRLGTRTLGLAAASAMGVIVTFEIWRWRLPLGQNPRPTIGLLHFPGGLIMYGCMTYFTLALCLAPAVLIAAGRHRWTRRDGGALGVGFVLISSALLWGGVLGRYLSPSGEYFQVLAGSRVVLSRGVWDALLVLGSVSGSLLMPVARRRWRSLDPLLGLFTVLAFVEIVVIGAAGNGVWDRYLPALVPGTLALVLAPTGVRVRAGRRRGSRPAGAGVRPARALLRGAAVAALAFIAVVSASLAANGDAFDAARWHAAQRLAQTGVAPSRIDAGMEWDGWHSPHGMIYSRDQAGRPGGWELAFSRTPACLVLSASPLRAVAGTEEASWTPAASFAYRTFLIAGRSRLYAYRTHAHGCGS